MYLGLCYSEQIVRERTKIGVDVVWARNVIKPA